MTAPEMTDDLARAAATDAGNRSAQAAGRTTWGPDDLHAAAAEYNRLTHRAIINGHEYVIVGRAPIGPRAQADDPECRGLVAIRRPRGRTTYWAKDYGPHPVYGENRRYVLCGRLA